MSTGIKYIIVASIGAAIGAIVTNQILKPKYEKMVQDEVNEFKKDWSNRNNQIDEDHPAEQNREDDPCKNNSNSEIDKFENIIEKEGYFTNDEKGGSKSMIDGTPYVISPLKFAEEDEYETISLTYYVDGVLTDDRNEPIDDIAGTVGTEFPEHFGEYTDDPDTVYVRNDRLETDYEIQRDLDTYADSKKRHLNPTYNE